MTETSTTVTTPIDAIQVALALDLAADVPRPAIQIQWHQCDEAALRTIMAAFPETTWRPQQNGTTEWISGLAGTVRLTAFAVDPEPTPTQRLAGLFPDQAVPA